MSVPRCGVNSDSCDKSQRDAATDHRLLGRDAPETRKLEQACFREQRQTVVARTGKDGRRRDPAGDARFRGTEVVAIRPAVSLHPVSVHRRGAGWWRSDRDVLGWDALLLLHQQAVQRHRRWGSAGSTARLIARLAGSALRRCHEQGHVRVQPQPAAEDAAHFFTTA